MISKTCGNRDDAPCKCNGSGFINDPEMGNLICDCTFRKAGLGGRMFKITIEGPDLEQPVVFEYERVTVVQERWVERVYAPGAGPLGPYDLVYNGQKRLLLKAWSGCRDYESFVTSEEISK